MVIMLVEVLSAILKGILENHLMPSLECLSLKVTVLSRKILCPPECTIIVY